MSFLNHSLARKTFLFCFLIFTSLRWGINTDWMQVNYQVNYLFTWLKHGQQTYFITILNCLFITLIITLYNIVQNAYLTWMLARHLGNSYSWFPNLSTVVSLFTNCIKSNMTYLSTVLSCYLQILFSVDSLSWQLIGYYVHIRNAN